MPKTFWTNIFRQFSKRPLGMAGLIVVALFCFTGIYAPFMASSKPFFVYYDGHWYFPFFKYLFYGSFYTKKLDLFYNLLMFTLPVLIVCSIFLKGTIRQYAASVIVLAQFVLFAWVSLRTPVDPAWDPALNAAYHKAILANPNHGWQLELKYMSAYAKLNLLVSEKLKKEQNERLQKEVNGRIPLDTLWEKEQENERQEIERLKKSLETEKNNSAVQAKLDYIQERRSWIESHIDRLQFMAMPFIRPFHWEDDAGGDMNQNKHVSWWDLTRINRKDLVAALLFGIRISMTVGILAVALALIIGVPVGAFAGYYGGKWDIAVSRMMEVWESMPTFFMLLMVVAITQSKSIFLVIGVIGIFGWTGISRFIRGEFFKQRNLAYVEACHALGFRNSYIMYSHILPNAIPPVLTLLPFAIMGAITSEAGLSFLGLGEEGSCSWGVLMDEGRTAFPGESYLLWPPAILLTILLVAIALVGDAMRDAFDPKMQR